MFGLSFGAGRRRLASGVAGLCAAVVLAATPAAALPVSGTFDASGDLAAGTDLSSPGTLIFAGSVANLNNGDGDYTGIPATVSMVTTIDPVQGAALPIDTLLEVVGNGFDLDFILTAIDNVIFGGNNDFLTLMLSGQGTVSGITPTDAAADGSFGVQLTAQQGVESGEGSWSASFVSPTDVAVPEPEGMLLMLIAGIGLIAAVRRRPV